MKEDLLKLKKELELERKKELKLESEESEQKAKKYGLFSSESGFYYNPEFGRKTLLEIKRLEDTDGFIEQFENFAKDIIRELVAMNQQFDVLKFASFTFSLLCDADCAYKLLDIDSREEQGELILANSCLEYIPIDFEFFNLGSGYYDKDGNFISLGYDSNIHYKYPDRWEKIENFSKKHIFAIVDFNKFIRKMKDIGYIVELADFGPCESVSDYISYSKDSLYSGALVLSIDFNLEKTKNPKLRVRLKK